MITADRLVSPRSAGLVDSSAFNPAWNGSKTLLAKNGLLDIELEIPADGAYALSNLFEARLGHDRAPEWIRQEAWRPSARLLARLEAGEGETWS